MPNVLFVCTANICRSPVAEVLFADWLKRQAIPGEWRVGSAGTWAQGGGAASAYSREVVGQQGLSLEQHQSRRVDGALLAAADLVLCMTRSHCEALVAEFPQHAGRIHLLSAVARAGYDVADPYGGPRPGYVEMVAELKDLIERGGQRIVALARDRQAAS